MSDTALCFTSVFSSFGDKRWRSSSSSFIHECWVIVREWTQPQISVPSYKPGASPQHSLAQVRRLSVLLFRSGRFRDPCCPHQGTAGLPKRRKSPRISGQILGARPGSIPIPLARTSLMSSVLPQVGWVNMEKHADFSLIFDEQKTDSATETEANEEWSPHSHPGPSEVSVPGSFTSSHTFSLLVH